MDLDLPQYASIFSRDTIQCINNFFDSDFINTFNEIEKPYVRSNLYEIPLNCYDSDFTYIGTRSMHPMTALAHMLEPLKGLVIDAMKPYFETDVYEDIKKVFKILEIGPLHLQGYFLMHPEVIKTKRAYFALGQDPWAFLVTGFCPEMLDDPDVLDTLEEGTSTEIVNVWIDVI